MLPRRVEPYAVTPGAITPNPDQPESILNPLAEAVIRHRLLILICMVVAVVLAAAYTRRVTPVYEATSVIRFDVDRVDLPQLVQQVASENMISTELEVLHGRNSALAVVDSLGLRARLVDPPRAHRTELFSLLRVLPWADSGTLIIQNQGNSVFTFLRPNSPVVLDSVRIGDTLTVAGVVLTLSPAVGDMAALRVHIDLPDEAVRRLQAGLKVSRPVRDADLIAIRARATDPIEAAAMANLLAQNVISQRQVVRRARIAATTNFLRQQANVLRGQLRTAEDRLRSYQEHEHVIDAPEQARSQVARLATLQADLAVVRADRDAFGKLIAELRADKTNGPDAQAPSRRFMAFPSLLRNQAASALLAALAQAEQQRADLLIRRKPEDPDVQVLTTRTREIETQLEGIAESFQQSLTNQVASLEGEAARFSAQLDRLPERELQSARRERDAKVLNDLWVLVQTRLKEAEITGSMGDPTVRLVDAAAPALGPVRPNLPVNLGLSLALGAMIGVGISLTREIGNRSVRSRADALAAAGLPVLTAIPRLTRRGFTALPRSEPRESIASMLVTRPGTPAGYVESFNQLYTSLALTYRESPLKVVVFTSPLPGEGKTLSALNFALIGASRGLRVLLIDGDLRCGMVSNVFGCARTVGFAELLAGSARAEEVLREVLLGRNGSLGEHGKIMVISSGVLPKVPGRILTLERVQKALGTLTPMFDFVVIDTPPVNLLADAAVLGSAADAVLLVVRAGHTQIDDLRYAMDQLESAGAPVLGTLLNDIDLRRHARDDGAYRYISQAERYRVGSA